MKEQFFKFLKDHNAYKQFIRNFKMGHAGFCHEPDETLNEYIRRRHASEWLNWAFSWSESVEGFEFWQDLNAEWL